jgi:hypothetical protein
LVLGAITVVGWGLFWHYTQNRPEVAEPEVRVNGTPAPIVADESVEFETVTDRTTMAFRDNAALALLIERVRGLSANDLAAVARHDILLAHLGQDPKRYRGIPVYVLGTANRVLRYPSKLSKNGWLYEAWVMPQETAKVPYVCIFEDPPQGFPIGWNVSETVVFNGYFLKIMKYQAQDKVRGAPVLVGRIGWNAHEVTPPDDGKSFLRWTLVIIAAFFAISLVRWVYQLRAMFRKPVRNEFSALAPVNDQIDPEDLEAWTRKMAGGERAAADGDDVDEH